MSSVPNDLRAHLQSGISTVCRAWALTRRDGAVLGFTDHDCVLSFDGITFQPGSGLTARAVQQATGLSVDNTEALGVLSDAAVREEDIEAGRFDGAEVRCWLVNWQDVTMRWLQFRGSIGEIRRAGGAFEAELRGLTEQLNQPQGRIFQTPCTAVLGDSACGFDLSTPGYAIETAVETVERSEDFRWNALPGFEPGWFADGRLTVLSGAAQGLWAAVKSDQSTAAGRRITLWEPIRAVVQPGDTVRLEAGCDKRMESCRLKFNNLLNFQGFPDIPGEDWIMAVPRQSGVNTGGSRR
ncbi:MULTISPECIES: DUF2163 domain-containing protein [unclassified Leisingera]|uniref:DUF2163 domain-containing protein n=1 Tax=unclassified Leisingera TaxID=2614906 RepID=UPI0002E6D258|nr:MULTISPECIES: DUF2163 domain-containing protein [unclassified Leisingera]KIC25346.1 phage protein [Leisingera sp. ANG-S3]KIC54603.1 phage protein [Leisingera sp. ANG-S]KID10631.1 phage protein [Leisingera sp. ANG1]